MSTPLDIYRIRMHSDPNGASIPEGFRLLITLIGCSSSQIWMSRDYVFVIWWSRSISVRSKVIVIGLSSTSVCVIDIAKYSTKKVVIETL